MTVVLALNPFPVISRSAPPSETAIVGVKESTSNFASNFNSAEC